MLQEAAKACSPALSIWRLCPTRISVRPYLSPRGPGRLRGGTGGASFSLPPITVSPLRADRSCGGVGTSSSRPPGGRQGSNHTAQVFGQDRCLRGLLGPVNPADTAEHTDDCRMAAIEALSRHPVCRRNRCDPAI